MLRGTCWPLERLNCIFSNLDGATGFALAVSGGADSLALLHLFHDWHEAAGDSRPVMVFTVDHGLRPEAAEEAVFVEAEAAKCAFPHQTLKWTQGAVASRIQERAREARYGLLTDACHEAGLSHLLLAHHLDDQAETVLMRALKGSGVDGLAAMRRETVVHGITALRPLLNCRKSELQAYLEGYGVTWIDDPSNLDPRFERVRMRALLDHISAETPNAAEGFARLATRAARASDALEWYAARAFDENVAVHKAGFCTLSRECFFHLPEDIRLRVLARAMRIVSGGRPFKLDALEAELPAIMAGRAGYSTTLGYTVLGIDNTSIAITREAGRGAPEPAMIEPGKTLLWDRRMAVSLAGETSPLRAELLGERWGEAREAMPALPKVIPSVRPTLLSLWAKDRLVALPGLDAALKGIETAVMFPIHDENGNTFAGIRGDRQAGG